VSKKLRFAGRVPKEDKIAAVIAVYEKGDRGYDLANKLTKVTGQKVTRSAVLGFYARNRLQLRKYPLQERRVMPRSARAAVREETDDMKLRLRKRPEPVTHAPLPIRTEEMIPPPKVEGIESLKIPLMQLGARQCHWPTHETVKDGHLFCGHLTKIGKSYCAYHQKVSQQKTYREMRDEEARQNAPKMVMLEGPVTNA
jgi:hypothetical protein